MVRRSTRGTSNVNGHGLNATGYVLCVCLSTHLSTFHIPHRNSRRMLFQALSVYIHTMCGFSHSDHQEVVPTYVIACVTCALQLYSRPRNPVNPLSQHFLQNAFARLRVFSVVHTSAYKQSRDSKVLALLNTSQSNFLSQLRYLITL